VPDYEHLRIVVDTNVALRGLTSIPSIPSRILEACSRRKVILLLSRVVLAEYRAVLDDPVLGLRFSMDRKAVALSLRHLCYLADVYGDKLARFRFPRDPRDACFIELAITGNATHLITNDQDILSLPTAHTDAGKRFRQRLPGIQVLHPGDFVRAFPDLFPR